MSLLQWLWRESRRGLYIPRLFHERRCLKPRSSREFPLIVRSCAHSWPFIMLHTSIVSLTASLALVLGANAQVPLYGQCGGQGWSGPTSCVPGAVCTAWNSWYCTSVASLGHEGRSPLIDNVSSMRPWNKHCADIHHNNYQDVKHIDHNIHCPCTDRFEVLYHFVSCLYFHTLLSELTKLVATPTRRRDSTSTAPSPLLRIS
jgi:hypothetical protein